MAQTITQADLGQDNSNQLGPQQVLNANGQPQAPNSSNSNSQQNAPGAGQAGASAPAASNPNQQKGTGYTNIQRIVSANQGNQLGQAVGGGIQQAGQQLQGNVNQAQQDFQNQTNQNQFNTDANKQTVQNVLQDPTKYSNLGTNDPNSQAGGQFQRLMSGQYQGPRSLQNQDQLQSQAQDVNQMSQALGNAGGRIGLLQRFVGNPQYSAGQQNLDSLLLGQTGGDQIAAARQANAGLGSQVTNAVSGAQAQGQQMTNEAQTFGQNVQNQFGQNIKSADDQLSQTASSLSAARDAQYAKTIADLQAGNVNSQEAGLLGLTNGQNTLDVLNGNNGANVKQFVKESTLAAADNNVASADDYNRMQALQKLGSQYADVNTNSILTKFNDPSQANKFQNDTAITGDKDAFNKQLSSEMTNYNSIAQPATQRAQDANEIYRFAAGNVNQGEIDAFKQSHPQYAGYSNDNALMRQAVGQSIIQQRYPGASTGGTTRMDWADSNAASAKSNYAQAMAQLQAQYGNLQTVNLQPDDPAVAQDPQAQSAYPNIMEKFPKVT